MNDMKNTSSNQINCIFTLQRYIEVKLGVTNRLGAAIVGAAFNSTYFPPGSQLGLSSADGFYTVSDWFVVGDVFLVDVAPGVLAPILDQPVVVGEDSPNEHVFSTSVLKSPFKMLPYSKCYVSPPNSPSPT